MEASAVPRWAPIGVTGVTSPKLLRLATDERLVALIRAGNTAAFEAAYDRHHRAILSFCRHVLGSAEEAEDAVQHTFLAAYNDLVTSEKPVHLRAWLFAIARNRCFTMLRSRREQPVDELFEQVSEGLSSEVQRRQDLRDLVLDIRRLPAEQRAALVLAEMDALSHEQIGEALGVPREKVKALVFQARESLIASRVARDTDCGDIRDQLLTMRGGALRRGNLRRHLRECAGCREFRKEVEQQHRRLALILPVAPTLALKEAVIAATVGGGAAATVVGGGLVAGVALKGYALKGVLAAIAAALGTAGTLVAVEGFGPSIGLFSHHLSPRNPIVSDQSLSPSARFLKPSGTPSAGEMPLRLLAPGHGTADGGVTPLKLGWLASGNVSANPLPGGAVTWSLPPSFTWGGERVKVPVISGPPGPLTGGGGPGSQPGATPPRTGGQGGQGGGRGPAASGRVDPSGGGSPANGSAPTSNGAAGTQTAGPTSGVGGAPPTAGTRQPGDPSSSPTPAGSGPDPTSGTGQGAAGGTPVGSGAPGGSGLGPSGAPGGGSPSTPGSGGTPPGGGTTGSGGGTIPSGMPPHQ